MLVQLVHGPAKIGNGAITVLILGFNGLGVIIGGSIWWRKLLIVGRSGSNLLKVKLRYLKRGYRQVGVIRTRSTMSDIGMVNRMKV